MIYPIAHTGAQAIISAVEKWIQTFGTLQSIVHDRGTASFTNTDFISWTYELGITLQLRTVNSLWTNGKIEETQVPTFCPLLPELLE